MSASFLPYAKQSINAGDLKAVQQALQNPMITRGPEVENFEKAIASECHALYAVAFNSGTSALAACYFAAELSAFDRVISTPNSFIATVGSPIQLGIIPQWVDLDRSTGNLDLQNLQPLLKKSFSRGRTFIVPVHFAGLAVDMAALDQMIQDPDTIVIEDAAHALGSFYPTGEKVGSCRYSQMTVFSFHPAKTITTGEGGLVTTNDLHYYHRLQLFRDNGIERQAPYLKSPAALGYYEVQSVTGNFNFTSFQAALGLSQLKRLNLFVTKRRELIKKYRQELKGIPHLCLLTDKQDQQSAFHLCIVQIDFDAYQITRLHVMEELKNRGIGTQVHYIPLYRHPIVNSQEYEKYPETELYYAQTLSLPLYYELEVTDVERICRDLILVLKNNTK